MSAQTPVAEASACGKFILLGEHFVVHGVPAVASPLPSVRVRVTVRPGDRAGAVFEGASPEYAELAQRLVDAAMAQLAVDAEVAWTISARSDIPVGHGLGSSAAFASATCAALARAAGQTVELPELHDRAHALERIVHGAPSGIDDTVVTYERALRFERGLAPRFLRPGASLSFVLAGTGSAGSTRDAVDSVRRRAEAEPVAFERTCEAARRLVHRGVEAFERGDASVLGALMDQNHTLLQSVGVSTTGLDRLVRVARDAGALGAKLTGAGLGGFSVALVDSDREVAVAEALRAAGASHVFRARIGPSKGVS